MIRRIFHGLLLSGLMISNAQATLPENVLLQRNTLRSLTLMLQLQGEGISPSQLEELQQDVRQLQQLLNRAEQSANDYSGNLVLTLNALNDGHPPDAEEMEKLHEQAIALIEDWHHPDADRPYLPLLISEYLAMRYAFISYIGNTSISGFEQGRYYTTATHDLLLLLDRQLTGILITSSDQGMSARWTVLHHALSDIHDGWIRPISGKPFTPIVVIRNSRVFGNELGQLLEYSPGISDSQTASIKLTD